VAYSVATAVQVLAEPVDAVVAVVAVVDVACPVVSDTDPPPPQAASITHAASEIGFQIRRAFVKVIRGFFR
jgi:hypothetical protein